MRKSNVDINTIISICQLQTFWNKKLTRIDYSEILSQRIRLKLMVNYGFHKAPDSPPWYFLNCFSWHLVPTFRHKRLVLPNPYRNEPTFDEAWNRDAELPAQLLGQALRSVVRGDGRRIIMGAASTGTDILCGYPPGLTNYTCDCGRARVATATGCVVSLVEKRSRAPCTYGVSFGCYPGKPTLMWTRLCRGRFRCGVDSPV